MRVGTTLLAKILPQRLKWGNAGLVGCVQKTALSMPTLSNCLKGHDAIGIFNSFAGGQLLQTVANLSPILLTDVFQNGDDFTVVDNHRGR